MVRFGMHIIDSNVNKVFNTINREITWGNHCIELFK